MSSNGGASNPNLPSQIKNVSSASTVIQTYVARLLHQPDITLPQLPKLAHHQAIARTHALYWQNTSMDILTLPITDIVDFGNIFNSSYPIFLHKIMLINPAADKSQLVQILQYFVQEVQDKHIRGQAVLNNLNIFHTHVTNDYQHFLTDEQDALMKITGANGELDALGKQLDDVFTA